MNDKHQSSMGEIVRQPPHPMWGLAFLVVLLVALIFSMWLFATDFDDTEGKAILVFFTPLFVGWGAWFWRWKFPGRT